MTTEKSPTKEKKRKKRKRNQIDKKKSKNFASKEHEKKTGYHQL